MYMTVLLLMTLALAMLTMLAFLVFPMFSSWSRRIRGTTTGSWRGSTIPPSSTAHLPSPLFKITRKILLLNFLDDVPHLNRVVNNSVSFWFFMFHDLKHRIFMQQLKVFAPLVCYLFLKNVLDLLFLTRFCSFLPCEILLIDFFLPYLIAPIVHPLHSVEMRPGNKSGLNLNPFELIVVLFLK